MKEVCSHCHTPEYVNNFYQQYDELVIHFNEKFARPGTSIMAALRKNEMLTKREFDEKIEWTWYYLWHHEGRRARHGASMMAPDYTQWHGMYEVAERFYEEFIPEAQEIVKAASEKGRKEQADAVLTVINGILAKPEHLWYTEERKKKEEAENAAAEGTKKDEKGKEEKKP